MLWGWFFLWFMLVVLKPSRKDQKGYTWRLLKKLPPWSFLHDGGEPFKNAFARWLRWMMFYVVIVVVTVVVFDGNQEGVMRYLFLILLELDDWFNADDDKPKKYWDLVRNKIKWKMELPQPVPVGNKVG